MIAVKRHIAAILFVLLTLCAAPRAAASASQATLWSPEGILPVMLDEFDLTELAQQFIDQERYRNAANTYGFIASVLEPGSEQLFALVRQADVLLLDGQYRTALDKYRELADRYADILPYEHVADNLRVIADAYLAGDATRFGFRRRRRVREIYDFLLDIAPPGRAAPADMLRMGRLQHGEGKIDEALATYQRIARSHPGTPEAVEARLARIELLLEQSDRRIASDHLVRRALFEAETLLDEVAETPAAEQAHSLKEHAEEILARHLLYLANFYLRTAHYRPQATARYIDELLDRYPGTPAAAEARQLRARLDEAPQREEPEDVAPPSVTGEDDSAPPHQPGTVDEMTQRTTLRKWLLPLPSLGRKDNEQD